MFWGWVIQEAILLSKSKILGRVEPIPSNLTAIEVVPEPLL